MFPLPTWLLLAADDDTPRTILQQLDKVTRGKLFLIVLGLIALVVAVSLLIWMGGWMTRRWMAASDERSEELRRQGARPDDWAEKPLVTLDEPSDDNPPPKDA